MPTATTPPVTTSTARPGGYIVAQILARLVQLNQTDPTIAALLSEYQAATGQPFGQ